MRNVAIHDEVESLVARVADEFRERQKQGERPTAEEYAVRHPDAADVLRRVLGALEVVGLAAAVGAEAPASAESHLAGTLGDYRIFREVGRGGMGIVYEAEQISLDRRVALKVLPYAATMDAKQLQRFKNEAKAAAGLHHEHIVPVFAVGCERGVHYYAMQFVDGQTLAQLIAGMTAAARKDPAPDRTAAFVPSSSDADLRAADPRSQTPDAPRATPSTADTAPVAALSTERSGPKGRAFYRSAAELMAQAADALEHAHQLGIVHRDVKPGNLMLDAAGKLWVTDFGLARFGPDAGLTLSGDLLGTLRYMAPEQALSHHGLVDHRADVYALGATLYELLTGRPVVAAAERGEILRQIAFEEPTRPRKLDKSIPIELETITMKCLTKNPVERYATAGALSDDLRRFLADQPIRARRAGPVERARRWGRRHPALAAVYGLMALVLVLATSGGAAAWQWQVAEAARGEAVAALQGEKNAQASEAEAQKQRDEVKALNDRLQCTLYAANMNLAQHALEAGGVERVRELLEQHRPKPGENDPRRFEWHYLYRLSHAELLTLKGHSDVVNSVAYSPDGKRVASASGRPQTYSAPGKPLANAGGALKVWDAQTGQELLTIKGLVGFASVAFSPDGKRLASAGGGLLETSSGGGLKVWDAQTGQELLTLEATGHSVAYSPDGKRLASAGIAGFDFVGQVKLWDAQTGQELLTIKPHIRAFSGPISSMAFSPDSKRLAIASSGGFEKGPKGLKVWDAQSGLELLTLNATGQVNSVAFSPDGKRLASSSIGKFGGSPRPDPGEVKVWDAQTGQELLTLKAAGVVAFSPDSKRLASGLKVWDAQTGEELLVHLGHTGGVTSVAFSPDGKRLASASTDGSVKVWPAQNLEGPHRPRVPDGPRVFSPDGKFLASTVQDNSVNVWNTQTGQEQLTFKGDDRRVTKLAFSPDGKHLAIARSNPKGEVPGEVKVWDAQTGRELFILKGHTGSGGSIEFSPDGKHIATGDRLSRPGQGQKLFDVKVWEAKTGQELFAVKGLPGGLGNPLLFSPDGKRLAIGSNVIGSKDSGARTMKVLDAHTGQEFFTVNGYIGSPGSAVFSPDGKRLAAGSGDGLRGVTVWDAQTSQELLTLKDHTAAGNPSVAFSPDGKRLASNSSDQTVKVWDAQTGQQLLTLKGHTAEVGRVAFSPDGKRLASGSSDKSVKVWDAQTGQELLTLKGESPAFSPDGHWLLSGVWGGTLKIWDATPLPEKR